MIVTISLFKSIIFTTPNRTIFFEHYAITNCILYICIQRASAAEMAAAVRGDKEQDEKNIMEDQEDWQDHPWACSQNHLEEISHLIDGQKMGWIWEGGVIILSWYQAHISSYFLSIKPSMSEKLCVYPQSEWPQILCHGHLASWELDCVLVLG